MCKFWKYFENLENMENEENYGKFRKVLKMPNNSNKFEEKKLLEDDITRGVSQFLPLEPWYSPFIKVILYGCMNDIPQLRCITYIF